MNFFLGDRRSFALGLLAAMLLNPTAWAEPVSSSSTPPTLAPGGHEFVLAASGQAGGGSADTPTATGGAGGDHSAVELAKKLSNPVASLISVPFQFNWDTGIGPKDADRLTLNVQPVIPFSLNADWNLISRTIVPITYLESTANGVDSSFGLGDTVQSFFFSPKKPTAGGWITGVGPVLLVPTATEDAFKSKQWGLGPTAVGLRQHDGWTYGALANHIWGLNKPSDRQKVDSTFIQPFLVYTTPTAVSYSLNTESTYVWKAKQWTVPINASVSKLVSIGGQRVSFQIGGRYYAEAPDGGPDWGLRFSVTLLFPK